MTWITDATVSFRVLVNDLTETYTYSDATIRTILITAARYVYQEVNLSTSYTISVGNETITPDPSTDTSFINLIVLKSACLVDQWDLRTRAAMEGVKAVAGPASLAVTNSPGYKLLMDYGACKTYNHMVMEYNLGNVEAVRAVLSPFVSNNYNILRTSSSDRYREIL